MSNDSFRLEVLVSRVVDGMASEAEMAELEALLRSSEEARRCYVHAMDLHAELQSRGAMAVQPGKMVAPGVKRPFGLFAQGSRWSMAAGVILGVFGASLVFGAVSGGRPKGVPLLRESFEQGPDPRGTGIPREADVWSGDSCEVVSAQGELRPARGEKMLRLLRADYEGKPNPVGSRTSGIWRLVDLRSFGSEIRQGNTEVQLSALVNATPSERDYAAFISVYAWGADVWSKVNLQDGKGVDASALALSRGSWVPLDKDSATWQPLDAALRLPAGTEFVLIQAAVKQVSPKDIPVQFGEQYLDHVRMTLWSRSPMQ